MVNCRFHPDQLAVGVCMRCGAPVCAGCRTRVNDVNHCHACLKQLAVHPLPPPASSAATAVLLVAAACLLFFGVFWATWGSLGP